MAYTQDLMLGTNANIPAVRIKPIIKQTLTNTYVYILGRSLTTVHTMDVLIGRHKNPVSPRICSLVPSELVSALLKKTCCIYEFRLI